MRDNRSDIFEKKFIDSQWAEMGQLLDRNLPVAQQTSGNRSAAKYTYLLITLLLLTLVTAIFYAYKYKQYIPTAQLTKEKVIYKTIYLPQTEKASGQLQTTISSAYIETVDLTDIPTELEIIEPQYRLATKQEVPVSVNKITQNSVETIEAKSQSLTRVNSTIGLNNDEVLIEEPTKPKKTIKYQVGIQTTASTDLNFTGLGIESGLTIPISGKVGLNTGIAFNYLSRENYFTSPFIRNNEGESLGYKDLVSVKQVYIPIRLNYSFTKHLALNSGLRVRYTYDENTAQNFWPRPSALALTTPGSDSESFLDNTNVGLTAGFMFKFNKHFSILLDSEWRMGSFFRGTTLLNPYRPNYDRNTVNLTTNYTF